MFSEIGTVDPLRMTGSGGSDGQRGFALYGGLIVLNGETGEIDPLLAQSFEPDATFTTWTLKLKPGITFSDGTPMNAAAVKVNWERIKDITARSPALTTLLPVTAMTPSDDLTLVITLGTPNAFFDHAVARVSANYIVSATAIANKADMTSTAYGAGPFLLKEWIRDNQMTLTKNPNWKGSDGPYLDTLILRTVSDEDQRIDTFTTGQADGFYTSTPASVTRAQDAVDDSEYAAVAIPMGQSFVFNLTKPPFNDVRMRRAYAMGTDWQALAETVFGEGAEAPYNFSLEGSQYYTEDAELPAYDPAGAQKLIDEYVAANGGQPVTINHIAFQQTLDLARVKFIQTSLNQLKNIKVEVQVGDSPSNIGKVLAGDFMVSSWGFPAPDGDPGIYNSVHSKSFNNYSKYNNPTVDANLDKARVTDVESVREPLYQDVYKQLAEDIPFYPYVKTINGFVLSPDVNDGAVYGDGILRFDLVWKSN
ncbi:MAG TPA: ABC transporter substrate-binding protein [Acidimicrobiia bacterium]|nr:ABC transporter substrate-binding protein [Acidimicrobiia bacterium]